MCATSLWKACCPRHHPSQAAYFGLAASASGGVILPGDNLATVAVRDQLPANSITAASIQGLAFSALADPTAALHSANAIVASPQGKQLLLSALAINPQTGKPTPKSWPTETLQAVIGSKATIGLFAGWAGHKAFDPRGMLLSNQGLLGSTLLAHAQFASGNHPHPVVSTLAFMGDGGEVDTFLPSRTSTAPPPWATSNSAWARPRSYSPSPPPASSEASTSTGGTLTGTLQTTGEAFDNNGQSQAVGR